MQLSYKNLSINRKFGIEIELSNNLSKKKIKSIIEDCSNRNVKVSRYAVSYDNSNWHVKTDSSCGPRGQHGPNGVEIASFVCNSVADLNHVIKMVKHIKSYGASVNDYCGLHIHVDASDLNEMSLGRIIMHWLAIEPVLMFALPIRRWDNTYCKSLLPKNFPKLIQYQYAMNGYLGIADLYNPDIYDQFARRKTLNLVNYYTALRNGTNVRKTIELRWPEGSLDIQDIKGWVCFFVNFIENVKNRDFSFTEKLEKNEHLSVADIFEVLGFGHEENFSIFDKKIYETKTWLLKRFIKNENIYECSRILDFFHLSDLQKMIKHQATTLLDLIS